MSRRYQSHTATSQQHSPSPRLQRTRSESSNKSLAITLPSNASLNTPSISQRCSEGRTKSIIRSRTSYKSDEETSVISSTRKKGQENYREGNNQNTVFASPKLLGQRGSTSPSPSPSRAIFSSTRGRKSSASTPSAWALSPGRSFPCPAGSELTTPVGAPSPRPKIKSRVGGVSGVLKYLGLQKKGSRIEEEEFHQFRLLQNRLLQWRFANARAQASIFAAHKANQDRIFSVWLAIFKMRNYLLDKRLQVQKLQHQMMVYQILKLQIPLLNEWGKLEKRNQESVSRTLRKLSGISNTIPLVHDAKADVASVHEALIAAMDVMAGIQANVTNLLAPLEKILFMVTELLVTQRQQTELERSITSAIVLMKEETSVRAHLIQVANKS